MFPWSHKKNQGKGAYLCFAYCAFCLVLGEKTQLIFPHIYCYGTDGFQRISQERTGQGAREHHCMQLMTLTGAIYHKAFCKVCSGDFSSTAATCVSNKQETMSTIITVKQRNTASGQKLQMKAL